MGNVGQRVIGFAAAVTTLADSCATVQNVGSEIFLRGSCPRDIVEVKGDCHRAHLDFGIQRQPSRVVFR
jgi:hypothetical protein